MKIKLMTASAILPFMMSGAGLAQEAADTSGADERRSLDTVVVTAQKREQTLQEVPAAVTAVSGEQFLERGFNDATDLAKITPNLVAATDRGDVNLSIRGVGSRVRGSTPAVALHIDGVYQPRAAMANLTQVDLDRVEVLRGPQGTLYGRNANGGAINFITPEAGDELGGYALGRYGNFDEYRLQGAVDLPLSDSFSLRLTGDIWERGEGTVEHVFGGQDLNHGSTNLLRARADWDVTESLDVTLLGTYSDREGPFNYFQAIDPPSQTAINLNLTGMPPQSVPIDLSQAPISLAPNTTAADTFTDSDREYTSLAAIVNLDLNETFAIKSITAYQDYEDNFQADFDGTGFELTPNARTLEAQTFTQELNLLFDTDSFAGVLGAFYMDDASESSNRFDFGPTGIALTRDITNPDNPQRQLNDPPPGGTVTQFTLPRNDTESFAIFADATLDITDKLSVFGGIRYSEDTINIEQFHTNELFFFPAPINGPALQFLCRAEAGFPFQPAGAPVTSTPLESELSYSSTTPRVGVNYEFSGESSVYASYSEGFKTGGFNTQTGCGDGPDDQFDSETVNSLEFGTKNTLLDGSLILNASAYFYDYENLQVEQLLGFGFAFENAEGAEVYGVEVETQYAPDDHLTITANLSLQSSEFTDFENVDATNNFTRDANGDVVTTPDGNALPFVQQLDGNTLPYAPDMTANLGVTYRTDPILAGGSFLFAGSASYQSEINFREFENPNDVQEAYTLFDGSIAWENADQTLTVSLFGKNIFDEEYIVSAAPGSATNSNFGVYGLPQQYGIELRKSF